MQNIPLHPVLVHFPVSLAALSPLLAIYLSASFWRKRELPTNWNLLVVVLALALLGGVAATRTGEVDQTRVKPFVVGDALHAHEELAECFLPVAGSVLLAAASVPLVRRRRSLRVALVVLCLAGTFVLTGVTLRIGRSGGELVYANDATRAFFDVSTPAPVQRREPREPSAARTPANGVDRGSRSRPSDR